MTVDPGRMRGLPCIRDTRVTVSAVLGQLAAGRTVDEFLVDYPYLERDDELPLTASGSGSFVARTCPPASPGRCSRPA